jgi:hypothetical protein
LPFRARGIGERPDEIKNSSQLHLFIAEKQKAAKGFAGAFAPRSKVALFLRNQITKAFHVPFVAKLALGSGLQDNIDLPDYRE